MKEFCNLTKNNDKNRIAKTFLLIALPLFLIISMISSSKLHAADYEVLYDADGMPAAFMKLGEPFIYLASGDPVGYVDGLGAVYTFGGKPVGWYFDGVLYDNNGDMVAFIVTRKPRTVDIKSLEIEDIEIKETTPHIEPPEEIAGQPPIFTRDISQFTLDDMFLEPEQGV